MKHYKKGVTLLESLFVLGIMALIIGAVTILVSQNNDRIKANKMKTELSFLVQQVQILWQNDTNNQQDYNANTLASAIHKINPEYSDGNNIITPYGYTIGTGPMGTGVFNITLYALDRSQCIQLSSIDMSGMATAGEINDTYYTNGKAFTPYVAQLGCKKDKSNYVGWNFRF